MADNKPDEQLVTDPQAGKLATIDKVDNAQAGAGPPPGSPGGLRFVAPAERVDRAAVRVHELEARAVARPALGRHLERGPRDGR